MEMDQSQVPTAMKLGFAWGGFGVAVTVDWGQIAGFLASIYTTILICEWLWKRVGRDLYLKARARLKRRR